MLDVAVLDLLHEGFAAEKIGVEIGRELTRNDEKLVVDDFGERNGAASGNEMRAPLENEAGVPEGEGGENEKRGGKSGAPGMEELSGAIEENSKAENEEGRERNEKAVAVRRDAGPIGITGNENIKSEKGGEKRSAGAALPRPKDEETGDSEKKNGSPGKKAVVGGEKHGEEARRKPVPVAERNIAGFEGAAVNKVAGDESGKETDEENSGEHAVAEEKFRNARRGIGRSGGGRAKGEIILAGGFNRENGEDQGVGIVNVEHEAGDDGENQPLAKGPRGARLVPIPKEKSHGERGMRVGPGRIEIHVDGERASPPHGERGEQRPALFDIVAREAEGQKQTEKSVESGRQGHGDAVRSGKTIGGDGGTERAREKYADVRQEEKRRPENGGADGEMVFEVIGGRSKDGPELTALVEAGDAEAFVGVAVVLGEIEAVLDERGAGKSIIADAIAAHPRIQERQGEQKKKNEQPLRFP